MSSNKDLTFALMDAPFESARSSTALRLIDIATKRGCHVHVFAYEGAVYLPFSKQTAHANKVHGREAAEENHPLPRVMIAELMAQAASNGGSLDWINCGLCVDERGAGESIEGIRRGTPGDLLASAKKSAGTLVIPVK